MSDDDQDGENGGTGERVSWWGHIGPLWKAVTGLATLVGLAAGGVAIYSEVFTDKGPLSFSGDLDSRGTASDFRSFLQEQDGNVVKLDIRCVYFESENSACAWRGDIGDRLRPASVPSEDLYALLEIATHPDCVPSEKAEEGFVWCPDSWWLHVQVAQSSDAQVDNGKYGAGALVVKGHFTITVKGSLGSLPPDITNVTVRAVGANEVPGGS